MLKALWMSLASTENLLGSGITRQNPTRQEALFSVGDEFGLFLELCFLAPLSGNRPGSIEQPTLIKKVQIRLGLGFGQTKVPVGEIGGLTAPRCQHNQLLAK